MNYIAFKKFLTASGLSTRRFADLVGVGKTSIHRLAQPEHGGLTPTYVRSITPHVMRAARESLRTAGASEDEIHRILLDIFDEEFVPAPVRRAALTHDMLRFFGLERDPFAPPRDVSEVYLTDEMEQVLAALDDAIRFQGFMAVLAPVGAGKTVIKNLLMTSPRSQVPKVPSVRSANSDLGHETWGLGLTVLGPSFPDTSRITTAGIVSYILEHFGLKPRRSLVLAQRQLEDHLGQITEQGASVALCFDECHRLSDATLTALKNFYELGTGGFERYLGLVLFGQPRFLERLKLPRFREIAERLAIHELPALTAAESEGYLTHCLTNVLPSGPPANGPIPATGPKSKVQSPKSGPVLTSDNGPRALDPPPPTLDLRPWTLDKLFTPEALRLITARASTPLAIANLASAAMIEAYKKGERRVLARFVPDTAGPKTSRL